MPFYGVLPERRHLFQPEPKADVGVSDAAAWRLNPRHRRVYDKLELALAVGLRAAPCGVDPLELGMAPDALVFIKPVINLAGMSLRARAVPASAVPSDPGCFWCEYLSGCHTSTDCLVRDGEVLWLAHTVGSRQKDRERSVCWEVGVERPELEPVMAGWVRRLLTGYTGICNIEMIGGRPIEVHLRGSNGFFDLYGPAFMPAWVALVDGQPCERPPPIPGGLLISLFGQGPLEVWQERAIQDAGVLLQVDQQTPDRIGVLRCHDKARARALCAVLGLDPAGA